MDVSFLTPWDALFGLAAVVPLVALWFAQRRLRQVRQALSLPTRPRRAAAAAAVSLVLLPALVGVAAAQPVVVRRQPLTQRADAQAYVVFDTSRSMSARTARGAPSRLARAKREALQLVSRLGDIPVGIASMTDRTLPNLLPTTNLGLVDRTIRQSVGVDRPPPSQRYSGRATALDALVQLGEAHFYAPGVQHRIAVVFTDGESAKLPQDFALVAQLEHVVPPIFVHVWSPGERIFERGGKVDRAYASDPRSAAALEHFAGLTGGRVFGEDEIGRVAAAVQAAAGPTQATTTVREYARLALAPWFVLAGVLPLAYLFWRRIV